MSRPSLPSQNSASQSLYARTQARCSSGSAPYTFAPDSVTLG